VRQKEKSLDEAVDVSSKEKSLVVYHLTVIICHFSFGPLVSGLWDLKSKISDLKNTKDRRPKAQGQKKTDNDQMITVKYMTNDFI
jgi:hypothetical protein